MKIFLSKSDTRVYESLSEEFICAVKKSKSKPFYAALSGGRSAEKFFCALLKNFSGKDFFENVHFFWVDERCVPETSPESNFGNAQRLFFSKTQIPKKNIFRIRGDALPKKEALRYAKVLQNNVPLKNFVPRFDCMILGMGEDGHTASIFPNNSAIVHSKKFCESTISPSGAILRITMTMRTILNARLLLCPVSGDAKKCAFLEALKQSLNSAPTLPFASVLSSAKNMKIFTDISPFAFEIPRENSDFKICIDKKTEH